MAKKKKRRVPVRMRVMPDDVYVAGYTTDGKRMIGLDDNGKPVTDKDKAVSFVLHPFDVGGGK